MVVDTLQQVSRHFRIEKRHGQTHQLNQEIGEQGDIHPSANMQ